jgi:hypothetical protein
MSAVELRAVSSGEASPFRQAEDLKRETFRGFTGALTGCTIRRSI